MTLLYIALGAFAGALLGFAIAWRSARVRVAKRDAEIVVLKIEAARLEGIMTQERDADAHLANAFKALSADALKTNNEAFLELARTTLEKYQAGAQHDLQEKSKSVEEFVKPLKESLDKVNAQIEKIEQVRREDYGSLAKHVDGLQKEATALNAETRNLTTALRKPVVRGRWGEIQLRNVVEMAGMLEYCDFVEQPVVDGDEGRLRPDLIVKLPGGKCIVVDSKVPLESYLNAVEAPDDATASAFIADHVRQVKSHVTKLSSKRYAEQFSPAPELVVMFLPGENFFSAALDHDPALIQAGVSQNVIIATPTTLIGLLRAVSHGWKQERLAENAEAIQKLGVDLYNRIRVLAEHFAEVGTNLDRAVGAYNKTVGSLEDRVLPAARRFPELGVPTPVEIEQVNPVARAARTIQAPDLPLFPIDAPHVLQSRAIEPRDGTSPR